MNGLGLEVVGTERYKDGRYGFTQYEYRAKSGIVEQRYKREKDFLVTRFLVNDDNGLQAIAEKVKELSKSERKTKRGHWELSLLLTRYPSVYGYVSIDEIDKPDRSVIIAGGTNLPHEVMQGDLKALFSI